MKKILTLYCVLLLSSLILVSSTCHKGVPEPFPTVIGTWDYTSLSTTIIDSTGVGGYHEQLFDTGFARHSQNRYQFKSDSTVVYTDFTVVPNVVKNGTYNTVMITYNPDAISGEMILNFPPANPDTLRYNSYLNEFQFVVYTYSAHIFNQQAKNYMPTN
jgi:hypothetical protein